MPSRIPTDIKSLARTHSEAAIRTLAHIAAQSGSDSARVAACQVLLDRGWGKPTQSHAGPSGAGAVNVIIRHLLGEDEDDDGDGYLQTPR